MADSAGRNDNSWLEKLPFPVGNETLVRRGDPSTSKASAETMRDSERLGDLQLAALYLLQRYNGCTANELTRRARAEGNVAVIIDSRTFARRLSELKRAGKVETRGVRKDAITGRPCLTWWVVE